MGKLKTPFANLLPPLSTDEFESLKASIKRDGVRDAILVDEDGNIIDGHHRYKIDKDSPRTVVKVPSVPEKKALVYKTNLTRRNLSPAQKSDIKKEQKKLAKELNQAGWKQREIADLLGIDHSTVSSWFMRNSTRRITHKDSRVVIPKTEWGTIHERDKKGEPQEQISADYGVSQTTISRIVSRIDKKIETDRKIGLPVTSSEFSDIISVCPIESISLPDNSIDMIFTDPPYHDEYLDLYDKLGTLAYRVLKPGAYCVTYCGKMFLPDILSVLLSKQLEYVWTFAVFHPFSKSKINKHKIFENWRPIVAFKKPGKTATREWVQDIVRPTQRDKEFHEWQQDIESPVQYIGAYTKPGELVLDPFVGGGTTPVACMTIGRNFRGYDKDERAIRTTIGRLTKASVQKS